MEDGVSGDELLGCIEKHPHFGGHSPIKTKSGLKHTNPRSLNINPSNNILFYFNFTNNINFSY